MYKSSKHLHTPVESSLLTTPTVCPWQLNLSRPLSDWIIAEDSHIILLFAKCDLIEHLPYIQGEYMQRYIQYNFMVFYSLQ